MYITTLIPKCQGQSGLTTLTVTGAAAAAAAAAEAGDVQYFNIDVPYLCQRLVDPSWR